LRPRRKSEYKKEVVLHTFLKLFYYDSKTLFRRHEIPTQILHIGIIVIILNKFCNHILIIIKNNIK